MSGIGSVNGFLSILWQLNATFANFTLSIEAQGLSYWASSFTVVSEACEMT
jgi:hypothetical protein